MNNVRIMPNKVSRYPARVIPLARDINQQNAEKLPSPHRRGNDTLAQIRTRARAHP